MSLTATTSSIQPALVNTAQDGSLVTDSHIIAVGTDNEHRNVIRLVRKYLTDFETFGRVDFKNQPFETAGGMQNREIAILNREQAMFAMTLFRNNEIVLDFKKNLIRAFVEMEKQLSAPALSGKQLIAAALLEAQSTMQELETTVQAQATQLEVAAPKVTYHDTYVAESDQLSFRTVASTLDMGEKALRNLLIEKGWIYKETSSRRSQKTGEIVPQYRYSEYADKKAYFIRRQNHDAPRFRGEVDHTLKITPAGAAAIKRAVGKWLRADQSELEMGGQDAA
ncbi:Rha family transcriptional regulator [Corynebacterium callunae]|uniref:Rha family transcriptional regulator n=1 Tax=Corynebacterium callunae TaxID=1721 RepID=UPI001FFE69E9|nr:Rha family transcriptional regulator [Corynebacterium callunae]MCK2200519.1 phage regulatory protein/antirepressor Ant [Corynebacterium callunae]